MNNRFRSLALVLFIAALAPFTAARGETFVGVNLSSPLILSGNAGLYLSDKVEVGSIPLRPVLEGEVGIGGGKVMIGMDSIGDGLGFGIKASVLRTWFEPIGADRNVTYMGVELQGSLSSFVLSLGGYRRVEGDGDGWLGAVSIGLRI